VLAHTPRVGKGFGLRDLNADSLWMVVVLSTSVS
jgi:hypothetical protein